jgi:hypothetical protein
MIQKRVALGPAAGEKRQEDGQAKRNRDGGLHEGPASNPRADGKDLRALGKDGDLAPRLRRANEPFASAKGSFASYRQLSQKWASLHWKPTGQAGQLSVPPQPSEPVPHFHPRLSHVGFTGQLHWWVSVLQVAPACLHVQVLVPPQLSGPVPHAQPTCAQLFTWHPHLFGTPSPPQLCGSVQPPQSSSPPHWSLTVPQAPSSVHVFGMHAAVPHLLGPAPPQFCPGGQSGQRKSLPQPEGTRPHSAPCALQSCG